MSTGVTLNAEARLCIGWALQHGFMLCLRPHARDMNLIGYAACFVREFLEIREDWSFWEHGYTASIAVIAALAALRAVPGERRVIPGVEQFRNRLDQHVVVEYKYNPVPSGLIVPARQRVVQLD